MRMASCLCAGFSLSRSALGSSILAPSLVHTMSKPTFCLVAYTAAFVRHMYAVFRCLINSVRQQLSAMALRMPTFQHFLCSHLPGGCVDCLRPSSSGHVHSFALVSKSPRNVSFLALLSARRRTHIRFSQSASVQHQDAS